jgi:hypothetical protein
VRGEFSPDYFCYSGAAEAIHRVMPEAKLLVVLRNPPDMLESVSRLRGNTGFHNGMTFIETVERGLYLERGFYFKLLSPFYGLFPRENIHVVLYDDIVSDPAVVMSNLFRFLGIDDRFVPPALRERVNAIRRPKPGLITSSVNLVLSAMRRAGLSGVADAVATHRGLNRWYVRVNSVEMSPGVIPSAIRERLKVYYREDIIALQGLIDRDLSAWL